jgi:hypothetical protein
MTKNKGGRPPHVPTMQMRSHVEGYVMAGFTHEQIAEQMEMSLDCLKTHYKPQLDKTKMKKIMKMGKNVYARGLKGSVKDAHFWLRTQAGWKEAKDDDKSNAAEALLKQFVDAVTKTRSE